MSDPEYLVDRCVCFDVSFERMLKEGCESLEAVAAKWGCSTKCGLCRPYIERTFATGDTRHSVIVDPEPW